MPILENAKDLILPAIIARKYDNVLSKSESFIRDVFDDKNYTTSTSVQLRDVETLGSQDEERETTREYTAAEDGFRSREEESIEYPDGGMEAYSVVIGSFLSLFVAFGIMNTTGVIQAYVKEHQLRNESQSNVGWVFSLYVFFSFGGGIYTGPIFDFKGAKIPMIIGTLLVIGGMFATANCTLLYQFILAFGVTTGIGTSFIMTAAIGSVAHWFDKKKGSALGICSAGGSLGAVVWSLMLRSLYSEIGYVWTIRIVAFISALFLGIGCLLVKSRITKPVVLSPKESLKQSFIFKDFVNDRRFLTLSIAIFMCEFSLVLVISYTSSYTIYHGYSESNAFMAVIIMNAVGVAGRYLPNYLGDYVGTFNIMCICVMMCTLSILVLWLPFGYNLSCMYAFAGIYGFFSSSILSLTPVCCAQISNATDFGKRYGTVYFFVSFGNLIALPIAGAIIGSGSGYNAMIALAGALQAIGTLFWCISRYYCAGLKLVKV